LSKVPYSGTIILYLVDMYSNYDCFPYATEFDVLGGKDGYEAYAPHQAIILSDNSVLTFNAYDPNDSMYKYSWDGSTYEFGGYDYADNLTTEWAVGNICPDKWKNDILLDSNEDIIVNRTTDVKKIDVSDGSILWTFTPDSGYAVVAIGVRSDDDVIVAVTNVGTSTYKIYRLDASDGSEVWEASTGDCRVYRLVVDSNDDIIIITSYCDYSA